jgi:hypothetical protein
MEKVDSKEQQGTLLRSWEVPYREIPRKFSR